MKQAERRNYKTRKEYNSSHRQSHIMCIHGLTPNPQTSVLTLNPHRFFKDLTAVQSACGFPRFLRCKYSKCNGFHKTVTTRFIYLVNGTLLSWGIFLYQGPVTTISNCIITSTIFIYYYYFSITCNLEIYYYNFFFVMVFIIEVILYFNLVFKQNFLIQFVTDFVLTKQQALFFEVYK